MFDDRRFLLHMERRCASACVCRADTAESNERPSAVLLGSINKQTACKHGLRLTTERYPGALKYTALVRFSLHGCCALTTAETFQTPGALTFIMRLVSVASLLFSAVLLVSAQPKDAPPAPSANELIQQLTELPKCAVGITAKRSARLETLGQS
jgi:hypothetical protein